MTPILALAGMVLFLADAATAAILLRTEYRKHTKES